MGLCVRFRSSLIESRKDAECILMEVFYGGAKAHPLFWLPGIIFASDMLLLLLSCFSRVRFCVTP